MSQLSDLSRRQTNTDRKELASLERRAAAVGLLMTVLAATVLVLVVITESRLTPAERAHSFQSSYSYP